MDIRPLTPADNLHWATLLALAFQRPTSDMFAMLDWLHTGFEVVAYGAWDEDILVAQYACIVRRLHVPNCPTPISVGMSFNMCVHPAYRGQGLIKQVSQPVYAQIKAQGGVAGMGFSNKDGVKVDRRSKGYGYQVIGKLIPSLVWITTKHHRANHLELTPNFPTDFTFSTSPKSNCIGFDYDAQDIRLRYIQHPSRLYHYGVHDSLGIVVYRPTKIGGIDVVSLLGAYGDDLPTLIQAWASALRQSGIRLIHMVGSPQSALRESVNRVGISMRLPYSRNPYYLTVKPMDEIVSPQLLQFDQWDCVGGDIL